MRKIFTLSFVALILIVILIYEENELINKSRILNRACVNNSSSEFTLKKEALNDRSINNYRKYDKAVFVVGFPGSGTSLMKTILDVSPKINCGFESKFIPSILKMRNHLLNQLKPDHVSINSYYNSSHDAIRLFIIKIIEKGDPSHEILCAKDPYTINYIDYLAFLFPNIRVIFMVRDGRGSALSIMTREKKPLTQNVFYSYISKWNTANKSGYRQCKKIGSRKCLIVKYEDLVTESEKIIRRVIKFVGLEFDEKFLHHEQQSEAIEAYNFNNNTAKKIYKEKLESWKGVLKYDKFQLKKFDMFENLGYEL